VKKVFPLDLALGGHGENDAIQRHVELSLQLCRRESQDPICNGLSHNPPASCVFLVLGPWHPLVAGFLEVPPHSRSLYDDPLLAGKLALEDVNVYMRRQTIESRMKKSFTTTRYCLTQT
jgi:hypothetical protein